MTICLHNVGLVVESAFTIQLIYFSNPDNRLIVPGCLAHPADSASHSLLNTLATAKQKVSYFDFYL